MSGAVPCHFRSITMSDRDKVREAIITMGVLGIPMICICIGCFPSPREYAAIIIATVIISAFIPDKKKQKTDESQGLDHGH